MLSYNHDGLKEYIEPDLLLLVSLRKYYLLLISMPLSFVLHSLRRHGRVLPFVQSRVYHWLE